MSDVWRSCCIAAAQQLSKYTNVGVAPVTVFGNNISRLCRSALNLAKKMKAGKGWQCQAGAGAGKAMEVGGWDSEEGVVMATGAMEGAKIRMGRGGAGRAAAAMASIQSETGLCEDRQKQAEVGSGRPR